MVVGSIPVDFFYGSIFYWDLRFEFEQYLHRQSRGYVERTGPDKDNVHPRMSPRSVRWMEPPTAL